MSTSKTAFPFVTRLLADSSPTLSLCVLAVCATLAGNASAASFHCSTRSSASEKIVCADPELSSLDDRLAVSKLAVGKPATEFARGLLEPVQVAARAEAANGAERLRVICGPVG